jgi:Flp pilus assembly protein TadG
MIRHPSWERDLDMKKINQRGQILIFVTLGFVMLGLFVGMAIDFGRGYLERARISRTVDAVALAAARALLGSSAPSYEDAAVKAGCGAASMNGVTSSSCTRTSPVDPSGRPVGCTPGTGAVVSICFVSMGVTGGGTMNFVQVSGRSSVPTTFLRLLTFVGAGDYTTLPVAAVAEGGPDRPVDLMLILDRSGSMTGTDPSGVSKIRALKCALTGLTGSNGCPGGVTSPGFLNVGFTDNDKMGMTSFASRGCGEEPGFGSGNSTSSSDPCLADVSLAIFDNSQKTNIVNRINGLDPGTGEGPYTNTMEGLRAAITPMGNAFLDTSRASRKAVLLVTDGQPTALRLNSQAACEKDPGPYPGTTGNNLTGGVPWGNANGCFFRYQGSGLRRVTLNGSSGTNFTTTTPASGPPNLYQRLFSATRNAARNEAYQLRALGSGNVIVFVIGIGSPDTSQPPDYRLDANARCLLGLIANDPDVINDPSTNNATGSCAGVYSTGTGTPTEDTHQDLTQTTPPGIGGAVPSAVIPGQLNGKLFTVDLNGDVTAQLQDIFGQIAAILKLRLTI